MSHLAAFVLAPLLLAPLAGPRLAQSVRSAGGPAQEPVERPDQEDERPSPIPPLPPLGNPAGGAGQPVLGRDGQPLVPGKLPADTAPEAREAWARICAGTLVEGAQHSPVTAFDLLLDLRLRGGSQRNDLEDARYRYLAPGFLRATLESGNEHVRGPEGDWLLSSKTGKTRLVGRDFQQDIEQIDSTLAIARNFAGLCDPNSLRIASVRLLPAVPAQIPEWMKKKADKLRWVEIESPDLAVRGRVRATLLRARLGFEPATGRMELVLIQEPQAKERLLPSDMLIALNDFRPLSGYLFPHHFQLFPVEAQGGRLTFSKRPDTELWVEEGNLAPTLTADHFRP